MTREAPLILRVWSEPAGALALGPREWEALLGQARRTQLLARLGSRFEKEGLLAQLPERARRALEAELVLARHEARVLRWEVRCLGRVLSPVCPSLVLLKGAAYELAGLEVARGRMSSDIDVLVPREQIVAAEAALLANGWDHVKLEPYDQLYYREWTHELPPLRHRERETVVDVHHGILPVTSRLTPDPARLLARAQPLPGPWSRWKVLSPEHMVLHAAAHGFHDGELQNPLRDILDVDQLTAEFSERDPAFGDRLWDEASPLGLERPLHYALRYATRYFGTRRATGPRDSVRPALQSSMDACVGRAVRSHLESQPGAAARVALSLLYVRSHWLRMPPGLLVRHLGAKALRPQDARGRPKLVGRA